MDDNGKLYIDWSAVKEFFLKKDFIMKDQKALNQDVISISDNVVLKIVKKDDPDNSGSTRQTSSYGLIIVMAKKKESSFFRSACKVFC